MDQETEQQRKRSPLVLVLIIIILVLAAAAVVLVVGKFGEKAPEETLGDNATPLIGYEEGVTVVDDPDALQKAVDEMYAQAAKGGIPFEFQNDAFSDDGVMVECYIGNPAHASYDIYVQIFADEGYSDQIYLSGLIPPGKAMRKLNLDHSLSEGINRVYIAITQVDEDHATALQQAFVTMDFHVDNETK